MLQIVLRFVLSCYYTIQNSLESSKSVECRVWSIHDDTYTVECIKHQASSTKDEGENGIEGRENG